jgi:putative lipoprotein
MRKKSARFVATRSLAAIVWLTANPLAAQTIQGTATYRERMALPPSAVFEATLEDVSRTDAPATVFATTRLDKPGNPPIAFSIAYDPARIDQTHRYNVRARILVDGQLLFASDTAIPVITSGSPTTVSVSLRRVAASTSQRPNSPTAPPGRPLAGTYWKAVELAGKAAPEQESSREAHLQFQPDGRVSGSDGCNRTSGTYTLDGDKLTFGAMIATQMACANVAGTEQAFREALEKTRGWKVTGERLELFDAGRARVAVFEARAQRPMP